MKLMKIDSNDANLHKPYEFIQIGAAAKLHVANYKKSTDFKERTLRRFYVVFEVCMLLTSLMSHFMEKSPLKHPVVGCLCYFNRIFFADSNRHEVSKKQYGKDMEKLIATGRFKSKEADEAGDHYEKMLEELVLKYREEFANFDIFANRLDGFIIPLLSVKKLEILSNVYILILLQYTGSLLLKVASARIRNI